jgi:hypothetical protein
MTEERIARLLVHIRDAVIAIIPVWFVVAWFKSQLSLYVKRDRLKRSLLINMDGRFEIAGKRGYLVHFGWWYLTLKGRDGEHHHVPMLMAVDSVITRLDHINGRVNNKKKESKL